jgi:hypothetical protein
MDATIAKGGIKNIATFCNDYNINRGNFYTQRRELHRKIFEPRWLTILVRDYGVSSEWLLTGSGKMFKK